MANNAAMERGLQLRQGKEGDVRIQRVLAHGPNDLQADDTLLTINNKRVTTVQAAQEVFTTCSSDEIHLEVSRGEGRVQEVFSVILPGKPSPKREATPPAGPPEPKESRSKPLVDHVGGLAAANSEGVSSQGSAPAKPIATAAIATDAKEDDKNHPQQIELPPPPQDAEDEKEKGNKAFKEGLWAEAIQHFTAAIEICGAQLAPHTYFSNRSAALMQNKEPARALEDADRAVTLKSDFSKGWYRKGMALMSLGRAAEAAEALRRGKNADPENVQIMGALARAEREAKGEGEKKKRGAASNGKEEGGKKEEGAGEKKAETLSSLWGDEDGAQESGGGAGSKAKAEAAKAKGNELFAKGQYMRAAEMFTEAMNLDDQNHVYPANRSAALLKESKAEQALDDALLSIKLCPSYAKGYYRKAQALAFLGRLDLAIDALKKSLEIEPDNETVRASLDHFTRLRNGEDPEAIMEQAATLGAQGAQVEVEVPKQAREGDNVTLQVNVPDYGAVKLQAKIPEGKKPGDKFMVSIGSMDELAETKKIEGIKAYKFGRMQKAADDFSDAIHLRPSDASLFVNRSAVLYALGRCEDALTDADKCIALQPSMAKGHYRRGVALAGLGQYETAVSALEAAVRLDGTDKLAAEQLQQAREDVEKQRQNKPTSREAEEEDEEEARKRERFVTKRAEAEVREQMHAQWQQSQAKKKALAGKALERAQAISNEQLSSEISKAKHEDQHKQDTERAKFQAVAQRVEYDQFEQMVAGASLKPTKTKTDSEQSGVILTPGSNASVPGLAPRLINPYAGGGEGSGARWLGTGKGTEMEGVQRGLVAGEGVPASCKEFLKWWKGLEKDPAGRYRTLRKIEPDMLAKIFRTEMEAEVLGDIIETLKGHAEAAPELVGGDLEAAAVHAVRFLNATTQLSRFKLNANFLGKQEKAAVKHVVEWSVSVAPALREEGDKVLQSFGCA